MSSIQSRSRKKMSLIKRINNKILKEIRWILIKNNFYKRILKKKYPINTPGEIVWVSLNLIEKITFNNNNAPLKQFGSVEEGEWDLLTEDINTLKIYKAFSEYISNKKSLKDTEFYNSNIRTKTDYNNQGGSRIWEYISEYEYDERIKKIDYLVNSIKRSGYLTQAQLGDDPEDEIMVKIGRNGEILFFNGIHRLCISKLLNIEMVPVIIKARHKEWVKLKEELYAYAQLQHLGGKHEGKLYQKLAHPDLHDIPYAHNNDDRFTAIKKNILTNSDTLLDIGANHGFFSSKFTELGYDCTAVELDNKLVYFLQKTNLIGKRPFKIEQHNILNMFSKPVEFDIVLALNILHHFLKTEENYNKLIALLKNLNMKEMFFEPHDPKESPFSNAYKNLNNEQFLDLILSNSNLTKYEKILDCYENRYLYHLWS
jgi:2-polyprenyl-3-methyl-5-hydroxy-6-metoxy-1,4-benzoquinol methylase